MGTFTLEPKTEHGVSRSEVLKQFRYFLKVFRDADLLESQGPKDQAQALKVLYRWGAMETGALANAARRHPDRLGLVDDEGELTFAEFWEASCRLALGLQARGIKGGSHVAVLARNGRPSILPLTCRHLLGFHIFMVNANSSARQIERLLEFHKIDCFIIDEEFLDKLTERGAQRKIILGYTENEHPEYETLNNVIDSAKVTDELPFRPPRGKHVVMTSGTSGDPKGVIRRTVSSPQGLASVLSGVPWEQGLVVMLTAVLFHAFGWSNLMMALQTSSTTVARRIFDPAQALEDIQRYKINAMATAASRIRAMHSYFTEHGVTHVPGMKFIVSAGSPLTKYEVQHTNELFGEVLCNFYGSTETACLAAARPEQLAADPTLTGEVYPGEVIEIRDDDGNLVPEGEIGRIWAGCYDMFVGYTDADIEIPTINGLINMGDRGYLSDGGRMLHVLGRADDLVITQFGEKIFPGELEDSLMRMDGVADVYAHGVTDPAFGQALRVYIIPKEGQRPSEDEVKEFVKTRLSDAHVPREVFFVDDFPRNPMGKVMKRYLPEKSTI
ncbi:AMP-binding protein [Corynebacterium poyangense]|uniref:AMP-binding protein n=1 Tax=Corynebacterium poyangense TaxID=2684405 RepID=A0A7H0SRC3_9CORY|nr:AMP-binding protein [Corynebacterium poyangense]MBZ8176532.1 AMP-binding protein [Corynebacterium poyangense]QNQ91098.1 AMP-binding protein [Corynebacterium poyangense]